ncbi:hypothetical protein [Acinetobacter pittii]|uniref:hypothetical protein n=1 Tax=Acinetobacter pittii TaxID=48296 RepID=UPI000A38EED8|nr:hypothetical protein [Acinetobacter pittii]MCF1280700.1 hypothetical protein [Acinetobacter pittii]MCU4547071.1 hypothetical protein [Acinetobacter pittii]OTT04801.1 hypothetical protein CAT55_13410 [Acinetobacter pittii]OTT36340.1 hypothetical protein CAS78_19120 [Acinetobacter pittii]
MASNKENLDIEVYKTMYDFQLKEYDSARARYARHEDKASKYLGIASIIIAAVSVLIKYYLIDLKVAEKIFIDNITILLLFICFISLCVVIRNLLQVMQTVDVEKLDTSLKMIDFFTQHEKTSIYYNLARELSFAIDSYEVQNKIKITFLRKAFDELKVSGLIFIGAILTILISYFMR